MAQRYKHMNETNIEQDVNPEQASSVALAARIAHEVNRAYCAALGDDSQVVWRDAPQWQKDSVMDGLKFHIRNPEAKASASHENWLAQKVADGWVYGATKNADAKQHPCMMPFCDLPLEQQIKDHLFRSIVHALLIVD